MSMQHFQLEHRFPAPPSKLLEVTDSPEFRAFLNEKMSGLVKTEQTILEDTLARRVKKLRTSAQLNLPLWLERIVSRFEPHLDQMFQLDRANLIERIEGNTVAGRIAATARYNAAPGNETVRLFEGSYECTVPLVGPTAEKIVWKQIKPMYDREAELTVQYLQEHL
ncbi:MAG: DUF2505 family protein [Bdellovibrionota bacterium]